MAKNIKVWQLKHTKENHNIAFMPLRFLKKFNLEVSLNNYHQIYEETADYDCSTNAFLEKLFAKFNIGAKPENYKGHSLSVSDIISIDDDYYYCDSIGFVKLSNI